MTRLITGMALACLAAAHSVAPVGIGYEDDPDLYRDRPKRKPEPAKYYPPTPDHAAHIAKAEAKRARKAARLKALSERGSIA